MHDLLYNPVNNIIHKVGMERTKKVNELMESNVPSWKVKLLKKFPWLCKKFKHFGYYTEVEPQPLFESDLFREKIILKHKGKTIAEDTFFVQDKRLLEVQPSEGFTVGN